MQERVNQIDPAMAEVLKAMNMISPVTPEGTPTVAATVLNAASQMASPGITQMSPSVGQAAEQAGIAAQLQAMKLQKAQEALMNQAMSGGVETLNPNIQGYAEGGIVGYAGDDSSYVTSPSTIDPETFRRDMEVMNAVAEARRAERERREAEARLEWLKTAAPEVAAREAARMQAPAAAAPAPRADIPPPPAPPAPPAAAPRPSGAAPVARAPGLATSSAPAFAELMAEAEKYQKLPRTGTLESATARARDVRQAMDEYARSRGSDPQVVEKMLSEYDRVYGDQLARIEERRAAAQERAERGGLGAWLRGFRQMQGQGLGEGFRTATEAAQSFDETMRGRVERLEDLGLEIQRARMEKINALKNQKYLTDIGDFKNAMAWGDAAAEAARKEQLLNVDLAKFKAGEQSQEARTAATVRAQEAARAESAAARSEQEKQRVLLSAQGRVTEAEKLLASVREKNAAALAMPATVTGPGKQMRDNAVNAVAQAEENLRQARVLYNAMINQNLGIATPSQQVTGGTGQFKLVGVQPAPR